MHSLPEYCCWPCPSLYDHSVPIFWPLPIKQNNTPCDKTRTISIWFLEHNNEFTVRQWPPQLLDLNPIVHLWDVLERESHNIDEKPTSAATGPKSLRNVSTTLLIVCHKELRHFWRNKVVHPFTKWLYADKSLKVLKRERVRERLFKAASCSSTPIKTHWYTYNYKSNPYLPNGSLLCYQEEQIFTWSVGKTTWPPSFVMISSASATALKCLLLWLFFFFNNMPKTSVAICAACNRRSTYISYISVCIYW